MLFFHFLFFCRTRDLFVSGFVRVARHHHPGLGCCAAWHGTITLGWVAVPWHGTITLGWVAVPRGMAAPPGVMVPCRSHADLFVSGGILQKPPGWTCLQTSSGRNYLSRRGTVENHTFSAFWLRSSVVSVLISLISGTWRMASHEFK